MFRLVIAIGIRSPVGKGAVAIIIQSSHADMLIFLSEMLGGFTGLEEKPRGHAFLLRICKCVCGV